MSNQAIFFQLKSFEELNSVDLYQILRLRSEVFVLEQNCAYLDIDNLDQQALHLYAKDHKGNIYCYARIIPPLHDVEFSSIGRVVVASNKRKGQLGYALMNEAIKYNLKRFPNHPIKISAQTYLSNFYQNLGFNNTGNYYLEDNIPHQEMIYQQK